MPRTRAALVLAAAALGGCGSAPPAPESARRTSVADGPESFQGARTTLERLVALRASKDAAGARALAPRVLGAGRSLLGTDRPEDLRREDAARYAEARVQFIDALNAFDRAAARGDDTALWAAADRVEAAFWTWYDAYRGVAPEGSV